MSKLDVVIKGGTVMDGLQTPRYKADVGIAGAVAPFTIHPSSTR
jgi:N-acyl-D-aspartate/D-glutamate deacylase